MSETPSSGGLLGVPVSRSVQIPSGPAFDPVRRALAAIDAVHGDGMLPRLPVVLTRAATEAGAYEWNDRTGEALRLRLSSLGGHPEFTVVHEIGHFLDHQALGRPGTYASETGGCAGVMAAIDRSAAIEALRALRGRQFRLVQERRRRIAVRVRQSFVEYHLLPRERFARAYAQFIAVSSHDSELLKQRDAVRLSESGAVYHVHWDDEDFRPIHEQFDRLFRRLRWMISQ